MEGVTVKRHQTGGCIATDPTARRTGLFTYGFIFGLVFCTAYVFFCSSLATGAGYYSLQRSQFSSYISRFFPSNDGVVGSRKGDRDVGLRRNQTRGGIGPRKGIGVPMKNRTQVEIDGSQQNGILEKNRTEADPVGLLHRTEISGRNRSSLDGGASSVSQTTQTKPPTSSHVKNQTGMLPPVTNSTQDSVMRGDVFSNSPVKSAGSPTPSIIPVASDGRRQQKKKKNWSVESVKTCDIFHGRWVEDDSYPLYKEGSCPHIDEQFNCFQNGRPDRSYQKLRWQPNSCNIPRLNATDMLERLRGKRLVFVGDSLNRNMWESLVCILKNSIKDKKKVFELSGRPKFRPYSSYSFLFKDYGCTVEFFRSPFLVREWEVMNVTDGKKMETLRLDIIERSSYEYINADIIVFNTGHWWTHDKTSKGKDYYQEGNHVYNQLNVVEAFQKALNTWAKWIDINMDPQKSLVFFRGYSSSHFSGGQWNSGGQCESETEPIKNEKYLAPYPSKMGVLESVLRGMKTNVSYLNITTMTDYRKDGHPSIYQKTKLTNINVNDQMNLHDHRYRQDCSHWCLPGVPDSWNELLYAQLLIK